jgi:hypothetical protein
MCYKNYRPKSSCANTHIYFLYTCRRRLFNKTILLHNVQEVAYLITLRKRHHLFPGDSSSEVHNYTRLQARPNGCVN